MKTMYSSPELEIIAFETEDVITTSPVTDPKTDTDIL